MNSHDSIQFDNIKGNHQIQAYKEKDNLKNSINVNIEVNALCYDWMELSFSSHYEGKNFIR